MPDKMSEDEVWRVLTRNFRWDIPADFPIQVEGTDSPGRSSIQIFEIATAAVFASLRPDYTWSVTVGSGDDGIDFVGRHQFLVDKALGIDASITVGGQCKKRTTVGSVMKDLAGDLMNMAAVLQPTFFVVAFSANVSADRIEQARNRIESALNRHCHILDRSQVEGLLSTNLSVVELILNEALDDDSEVSGVVDYLAKCRPAPVIRSSSPPEHVLAGDPFVVEVAIDHFGKQEETKLRWEPSTVQANRTVHLVGPPELALSEGLALHRFTGGASSERATVPVEFLSYAVGELALGQLVVDQAGEESSRTGVGQTRVIDGLRPRFFDRPFRPLLQQLKRALEKAPAKTQMIAVTGIGGSGKSRLVEEFCNGQRRAGNRIVRAGQANTPHDPYGLLKELLLQLAAYEPSFDSTPVGQIHSTIEALDSRLAGEALPALQSVIEGSPKDPLPVDTEQVLVSCALVMLIAAQRNRTVVLHLADFHWAGPELLSSIEQLLWRLGQTLDSHSDLSGGVLVILEGRDQEAGSVETGGWSSHRFESFIEKNSIHTIRCQAFDDTDGRDFVSQLFASSRSLSDSLALSQETLIDSIHDAAGSNPFHALQQVELLKDMKVVRQDGHSGFLTVSSTAPRSQPLPETVASAVAARWSYLLDESPDTARLIWALALLSSQTSDGLFQHLWRSLASKVSIDDIVRTDFVRVRDHGGVEFSHEHYFQSIRKFELTGDLHASVIFAYEQWFRSLAEPSVVDQYGWARVLLRSFPSRTIEALEILDKAIDACDRSGGRANFNRISATRLDALWELDDNSALDMDVRSAAVESELALCGGLIEIDRPAARRRIGRLRFRLSSYVGTYTTTELFGRLVLATDIVYAKVLFNAGDPESSVAVAERFSRKLSELSRLDGKDENTAESRDDLAIEAHTTLAVGLALTGRLRDALAESEGAIDLIKDHLSPLATRVISTHANILLAFDPRKSEAILREHLHGLGDDERTELDSLKTHLAMALLLRAEEGGETRRRQLEEADELLCSVLKHALAMGDHSATASSALTLGLVSALRGDVDAEVDLFSDAIAAATRAGNQETLWRAHINLASSLSRLRNDVEGAADHAEEASHILRMSLSVDEGSQDSSRLSLVRVPLAQAARFLIAAGRQAGHRVLTDFTGVKQCFEDPVAGTISEDRGGYTSHEWIRIESYDYVLY